MRKIFFLIPALILAMMVNATTINITNSSPYDSDPLSNALSHAAANDTIVLAAGTYLETSGNGYINFDKNIVVKAADNAEVIIDLRVPMTINSGAKAEIFGLKFDGTHLFQASWYKNFIYATDNSDNNRLIFDGCDFYNDTITSSVIYCASNQKLDSLIINNCFFYNVHKSCIFLENAGLVGAVISNSTFANVTTASKYDAGVIDIRTTAGRIDIDHCTFYNCKAKSTDYGTITVKNSPNISVSNSIFSMPESYSGRAIWISDNGGKVDNCIVHLHTGSTDGIRSASALIKNNCVKDDPLFNDLANNKYTFANNWVTMALSPACCAATDGTDLGDPRWHTAGTLPSASIASSYFLEGTKANLVGNVFYSEVDSLHYEDKSKCGTAIWKLHVEAPCAISATANYKVGSSSGAILALSVFDSDNNQVGDTMSHSYYNKAGDKALAGCVYLPAAGDYMFRLDNKQSHSSAKLNGITLSYVGGAVQDIPATFDVSEAWYSAKGSRADNKISFTSYSDSWVKWNIATTGSHVEAYAVTLTIDNPTKYGHNFSVSVYEEGDETHAQTVSEHQWNETFDADAPLALSLGLVALEGGKNYVVKVTNAESGAQPKIVSVGFAHAGGAVQNIAGTFAINEAWYGNGGTRANGQITFSSWKNDNSWIKWNAATTKDVFCTVKTTVSTTNGHNMTVAIYEDETAEPIATLSEGGQKEDIGTQFDINLGRVYLAGGKNYVVKVTNPISGSVIKVDGVKFEEVVIPTIALPGTLNPLDAMLSERAWVDTEGTVDSLLFTARGDENHNSSQWAKWKISAASHGYYKFTVNAYTGTPAKAQQYILSVLSNDESEVIATKTTAWDNTNNEYADFVCAELEQGNYIVKVENPEWGSTGRVLNIVATYDGGAFTEIPTNSLLGAEAMLHATKMTRDENNDIQYNDNGNPTDEYVMWNIHVTNPDEMEVSFNVLSGGHQFSLELYKAGVLVGSIEEPEEKWGTADIELSSHLTFPEAGNYQLKLINNQENSVGVLHGITFAKYVAPEPIVIDENATTNGTWADYYNTGDAIDLSITRTLKGGIYNTICLPFELGSEASMSAAFGAGYELLRLNEATLEGGVLNLIFEQKTTMEYGVPYLIKPVADVVNPSFTGRKIKANVAYTETKGDVQFIGTFIKQTIDQDEHNLYLGNDNSLYFVNNNVTIKGMRGYFHLNIQNPQQVIRRAQIVAGSQVVTSVDFVKDANNATFKTIENGQLVIIRDGIRYNVMGVKIQ